MSEYEHLLFSTPVLAVKGAICFTCLKAASQLNKCGACKRVFYCSQKCQKQDWGKGHKALCRILVEINRRYRPCGHRTWSEYRDDMYPKLEGWKLLAPKFSQNDGRVLYYQPHCANCHRNSFQLPDDSKLRLCPACQLVHHCSSCSASQHEGKCSSLQEVTRAEKFSIQHYLNTKQTSPQILTLIPRKTYIPLSQTRSWYDYYTRVSGNVMFTGAVTPDLKPLVGRAECEMASRMLIAASHKSSIVLTIVAALEVIYPDLATKETLHLHLIGAGPMEMSALMFFEEILHLLPSLRDLHYELIGIELQWLAENSPRLEFDCCQTCTTAKRTRSMGGWKGAYHDYIKTTRYVKPDLAVAFHTGHSMEATEEWTPTIKYLVGAEHCTLFTTFNRAEMLDEMEVLNKLEARFLSKGKNRWRGMQPMLEIMERVENSVYYNNEYCYIVAGRGWSEGA